MLALLFDQIISLGKLLKLELFHYSGFYCCKTLTSTEKMFQSFLTVILVAAGTLFHNSVGLYPGQYPDPDHLSRSSVFDKLPLSPISNPMPRYAHLVLLSVVVVAPIYLLSFCSCAYIYIHTFLCSRMQMRETAIDSLMMWFVLIA